MSCTRRSKRPFVKWPAVCWIAVLLTVAARWLVGSALAASIVMVQQVAVVVAVGVTVNAFLIFVVLEVVTYGGTQ